MPSPDLIRSWKRTECYLLQARDCLSESLNKEAVAASVKFSEYIEHNELGLAFNVLESVATECSAVSTEVLEFLALAAASMCRVDAQHRLDARISGLRGAPYKTALPELKSPLPPARGL